MPYVLSGYDDLDNSFELEALTEQIVAAELIAKYQDGGATWSQLAVNQFRIIFSDDTCQWIATVTKVSSSKIMLDVSKCGSFYFDLDSTDYPDLQTFYDQLNQSPDGARDADLVKKLSDL